MQDVLVVDATRSPIGTGISKIPLLRSALIALTPQELALQVLDASFKKTNIPPEAIDVFTLGIVASLKSEHITQAPAREIAMRARMFNASSSEAGKVCSSGLKAVHEAELAVRYEKANFAIGAGLDVMCGVPDSVIAGVLRCPITKKSMAELSNQKTQELGFAFADCAAYADESYRRAKRHLNDYLDYGYLTPVVTNNPKIPVLDFDQNVTIYDDLKEIGKKLLENAKQCFLEGCDRTTVYTASKYGDAFAKLTLAPPRAAKELGIEPLARILGYAEHTERDPKDFPLAPVGAILKLCKKLKRNPRGFHSVWINEAFPISPLYAIKELGIPWEIVNPWGGAIAFGHALGATGTVLCVNAICQTRAEGKRYVIVALCNGIGEGTAMAFEIL